MVSVVIANSLHREVVEGLLAAGKHVLCEKPLSDTLDDAQAMVAAAARAPTAVAAIGFTFRRTPGIAYIRELIHAGALGKLLHFNGRYWTDYGADPTAPMSWRYKGGPGSGALADVGSHLVYLAEFLCGDDQLESAVAALEHRDHRAAAAAGRRRGPRPRRGQRRPASRSRTTTTPRSPPTFENGAVGSFEVSRVAAGHANSLSFEVFCENGAATFDQRPAGRVPAVPATRARGDARLPPGASSARSTRTSPAAWRWTPPVSASARTTCSSTRPARSSRRSPASTRRSLPRCATFDEGVHNMELLAAVAESAASRRRRRRHVH